MAQLDIIQTSATTIGAQVSQLNGKVARQYIWYLDSVYYDTFIETTDEKSSPFLFVDLDNNTEYEIQVDITNESGTELWATFTTTEKTKSAYTAFDITFEYYDWDTRELIDTVTDTASKENKLTNIENLANNNMPDGYTLISFWDYYYTSKFVNVEFTIGGILGNANEGYVESDVIVECLIESSPVVTVSFYHALPDEEPELWGSPALCEVGTQLKIDDYAVETYLINYTINYVECDGQIYYSGDTITIPDNDIDIYYYYSAKINQITVRAYCDTAQTCKQVYIEYNGEKYYSKKQDDGDTYAECIVPGGSSVTFSYAGHKTTTTNWWRCYGWYDGPGGYNAGYDCISPQPTLSNHIIPNEYVYGYSLYCFVTLQNSGTFEWDTQKKMGELFNLTANEWNRLGAYVVAKKNNGGGVHIVFSGDIFTADIYNSIAELTNTTPDNLKKDDIIKAQYLNNLRDNANKMTAN